MKSRIPFSLKRLSIVFALRPPRKVRCARDRLKLVSMSRAARAVCAGPPYLLPRLRHLFVPTLRVPSPTEMGDAGVAGAGRAQGLLGGRTVTGTWVPGRWRPREQPAVLLASVFCVK